MDVLHCKEKCVSVEITASPFRMPPRTLLRTVRTNVYCMDCRKFYFNSSCYAYGEDRVCTDCAATRENCRLGNNPLTIRVPPARKLCSICNHSFPRSLFVSAINGQLDDSRCVLCQKRERCTRCKKTRRRKHFQKQNGGLFQTCASCRQHLTARTLEKRAAAEADGDYYAALNMSFSPLT